MRKNYIIKKFEARNSLFAIQGAYAASEGFNKIIGAKLISEGSSYYKDGFTWHLGDENDYIYSRNWLIKKIKDKTSWGSDFYKKQIKILNNFIDCLPKFLEDIKNLSGLDLIKYTRKFIKEAVKTTGPAYFTDWYAYDADNWIKKYAPHLAEEQFRVLVSPTEISFTKEYEYALALLKLRRSGLTLNDIVKKYFWVQDNYQEISRINKRKVETDIKKISKKEAKEIIEFVEIGLAKNNQKREKMFKRLKLSNLAKKLLQLLADFVNLQDKRKAAVFVTNNVVLRAFQKILDYKGIKDPRERNIILQSALPFWITDKKPKELIKLSKKAAQGCLQTVYRRLLLGEKANKKFDEIIKAMGEGLKELKGYSASLGRTKGKVKTINKVSDFSKFNTGDILVTSMTRPEMMPIMKRAAAFITDEGGITCHAAIVSRELGIPCIIGTKIATKVLRDGQLVEVDANKGIVKII